MSIFGEIVKFPGLISRNGAELDETLSFMSISGYILDNCNKTRQEHWMVVQISVGITLVSHIGLQYFHNADAI